MNRNRIVNRPLAPSFLDAALSIARDGDVGAVGRERLEILLRDTDLAPEARAKIVEMVHPVWINPPVETQGLIQWAVGHVDEITDPRAVHLVAIMATFPFFGDACATVGRLLRAGGEIDATQLGSRMKARWGDRDAISLATRKCLQTLRAFGALQKESGSSTSRAGERLGLEGDWGLWALAALLLTRGADALDATTAETAPEFFFLGLRVSGGAPHVLLERRTSGDGRTLYALR
jgi:hypothetical protein